MNIQYRAKNAEYRSEGWVKVKNPPSTGVGAAMRIKIVEIVWHIWYLWHGLGAHENTARMAVPR
jgi:hypothetical protein